MTERENTALQNASNHALDYLHDIEHRAVAADDDAIRDLDSFQEELPMLGCDPVDTIEMLAKKGAPASMGSNGARYFGFVIGGAHPTSIAADWITSAWDQNAGLIAASPVSARIEEVTERWLKQLLPVAKESVVGFVTGVTMANFCALAAARTVLLQRQGWDVEERGLFGAPPFRVIISEEAHGSLLKALGMLGLGRDRVVRVPSDLNGRIVADQIPPLDANTLLCLQAGNVNTGGMDDGAIVQRARDQGAWVHIDGAFGLWAGACEAKRHLTKGYELADSWATDGHKWLNVPYDSGLVICRHKEAMRKALAMKGDYLVQEGSRIPYHYTGELSRRARANPVWAVLRTLGRKGVDDLIFRTCQHAELMARLLRDGGLRILNEVETNQVLVALAEDFEKTTAIIDAIQKDGTCWCGGTIWKGLPALRISVSSFRTTELDIRVSAAAILNAYHGNL